jgi:hypothetical protein
MSAIFTGGHHTTAAADARVWGVVNHDDADYSTLVHAAVLERILRQEGALTHITGTR